MHAWMKREMIALWLLMFDAGPKKRRKGDDGEARWRAMDGGCDDPRKSNSNSPMKASHPAGASSSSRSRRLHTAAHLHPPHRCAPAHCARGPS
jgi:hypothetical protein